MVKATSFPKDKIRILLLEGINKSAIDLLRAEGYANIESFSKALSQGELKEKIKSCHIVGIRSKTLINGDILSHAPHLLAVGAFCIGTNQIDIESCTDRGIAVFNSPFSNTRSVAELVLAQTILLLRKLVDKNAMLHKGSWNKTSAHAYEARGKTMGIVGYGHIGSQVSILAEALGMKVLYYDVEPKLPLGNARAAKSLDELLRNSDVITLHVPGLKSTRNMIDRKRLREIKKGSILINCSRGDLVVEEDVVEYLEQGILGGFAADVFRHEPASNDDAFVSLFQNKNNVFLTPHIGGSTVEAQENIGADVATKLTTYLDTGSTVGSITVPDLYLPIQEDTHRILHIHRNVPGVLSDLNKVFSDLRVNILGQYLKTNASIGYAVTDVDKKTSIKILENLKKINHTIRVRSLY